MPLLFVQAMVLRNKIPKLSIPNDVPFGNCGGEEPCFSLLVLGESPVAGYGLSSYSDVFAAHLAHCFSSKGHCVHWKSCGWVGININELRDKDWPVEHFDLVFVAMGVNDIKNLTTASRWRVGIRLLISRIKRQYPKAKIVFSGTPPVGAFPVLPFSLALVLGWRRDVLEQVLCEELERQDIVYVSMTQSFDERFFVSDRFHPSALAHKIWAQSVSDKLIYSMDSFFVDR